MNKKELEEKIIKLEKRIEELEKSKVVIKEYHYYHNIPSYPIWISKDISDPYTITCDNIETFYLVNDSNYSIGC